MKTLYRILGGALIIYLGVMAIMSLQYLFDRGDLRRASQFIYDYRPGPTHTKTVNELMAQALGKQPTDIFCESEIVSRTEGTVLLFCYGDAAVAKAQPAPAPDFEWLINLVSNRLQPNNAKATQLLASGAL